MAVARLVSAKLPEPNALVGGLAVIAHGYVRATDDVDFACPADPKEIRERLLEVDPATAVTRGDVLEGALRSCVYGTAGGIRFDVLFPPVPIDWKSTVALPFAGSEMRVVGLEDLIRLKLRAGGPIDLIDVVQLVRRHPELLARASEVADAYQLRDRLETWLADPGLRAPEETLPAPPARRSRRSRES
jgi:hypothetical protein